MPSPENGGPCDPEAAAPFDWTKFRLGGQFRIEANTNNFGYHPAVITDDQHNQSFVNQRYRLWLTYTPTEHVEGYIQMQVGGINWGNNFDFDHNFNGTFSPIVGDRVGIELRRAWLAYRDEICGKVRAGFLDWHDSFGDTIASSDYDFNAGGIEWTNTLPGWNDTKLKAAILQLTDRAFVGTGEGLPGPRSAYLFAFDADQSPMEKASIGASAYYLNDRGGYSYPTVPNYTLAWDFWFGVRGKIDFEMAPLSGFVIVNTGERHDIGSNFHHTGWAGQAQLGPLPFWIGNFFTQLVYASGDSNPGVGTSSEFRTVAQTARDNFGAQGYWSYLHITSPNGPNDVADLGVGLQDRGFGLVTVQAKYEVPLTKCFKSTTAVAYLRSDRPNNVGNSSYLGTELGELFTLNLGGGLSLDFGAAVLFTGDFYRVSATGPKPDNLYEGFARLQLEF